MTERPTRRLNRRAARAPALALLTVAFATLVGSPARAADPPPPQELLADRFTDASFGYSMRPPINSQIDQRKKVVDHGGYQLVEFNNNAVVWRVAVLVYRLEEPRSAPDLLRGLQHETLVAYPERTVVDRSLRTIGARTGGVLVTQYVDEAGQTLIRQEAVIPFDREQFYKVQMFAGQHDADTVRPLFLSMLDSFEFVHSDLTHRALDEALARGAAILRERQLASFRAQLVPEVTMLIRIDGEDVGFANITESAKRREGVDGVHVRERGWLFFTDGTIDRIDNEYFATDDLQSETFELRLRRYHPAIDGKPPQIVEQLDTGIRERDKLVLAYSERSGDAALANEVLSVPPSYLPRVAHHLIGRLLPLDRSELYAFATYSTQDRSLVLHTIRVEPPEAVSRIAGPTVKYKLLDGIGVVPPYAEVYCDHQGRIARVEAGGRSFIQAAPTTADRLFSDRVRAAEEHFAQMLGENK